MSDKTKAAPHGRQCSTTKQIQHTRTCAGGQRMSQRNFAPTDFIQFCTLGTAALAQLECAALQHTMQKSRSCEHYPVSGNQPYMVRVVLPGSSGVAKMQLGQLPYNFRHWQGYAAVPYTLKEISPNLERLVFNRSPKQRGYAALQYTSENSRRYPDIGYHSLSASLAFLRCRRLISPLAAHTRKPAVLSPSSLRDSISATTSCGTRTVNSCDFAFLLDVAITDSFDVWCVSVYAKKSYVQCLKCVSLKCSFESEGETHLVCAKPGSARNTNRASYHNVIGANTMADQQHTQTRPEFTWLFLATPKHYPECLPIVLRFDADTEEDARDAFPGWDLIFAAKIRAQAPCRVAFFDYTTRRGWEFDSAAVQEVRHA